MSWAWHSRSSGPLPKGHHNTTVQRYRPCPRICHSALVAAPVLSPGSSRCGGFYSPSSTSKWSLLPGLTTCLLPSFLSDCHCLAVQVRTFGVTSKYQPASLPPIRLSYNFPPLSRSHTLFLLSHLYLVKLCVHSDSAKQAGHQVPAYGQRPLRCPLYCLGGIADQGKFKCLCTSSNSVIRRTRASNTLSLGTQTLLLGHIFTS